MYLLKTEDFNGDRGYINVTTRLYLKKENARKAMKRSVDKQKKDNRFAGNNSEITVDNKDSFVWNEYDFGDYYSAVINLIKFSD